MPDPTSPFPRSIARPLAALSASLLLTISAGATEFTQTVSSGGTTTEWNDAIWGSPAAAPTSGNTYVSAAGLNTANSSSLGSANDLTGRVRAYGGSNGSPTFAGDSLTIVGGTELLLKDPTTYSVNLILNGGFLRFSPNTGGSATIGGTINAAADSVIGVVQSGASNLTVNSTFTGGANLRLAAGTGGSNSLIFSATSDFSAYTGTLDIGGGNTRVTVSFGAGDHDLSGATLALDSAGAFGTSDILNLDGNVSVASFAFETQNLVVGTYSSADLNTLFSTTRFTGVGSLTVSAIPESSTFALLAGAAALGVYSLRRRHRR